MTGRTPIVHVVDDDGSRTAVMRVLRPLATRSAATRLRASSRQLLSYVWEDPATWAAIQAHSA